MATAPAAPAAAGGVDRKLQLKEVLDWLVQDGRVAREDAARLVADYRSQRGGRHPVTVISEARLKSSVPPHGPLNAEMLTAWLGARLGMPFYHIDPLGIDLRAVTDVMSVDYAQRRGILPVEVNGKEVTIATAEPFMRGWESELSQMLRLSIKRVIANPADIERYQGEFYNLAKSVKRAEKAGVQTSGLTNFEQLVAAGEATATLDKVMLKVAGQYAKDLERRVKDLVTLLEPLMVVVMAGVVGFVALSIMLPIFQMSRH